MKTARRLMIAVTMVLACAASAWADGEPQIHTVGEDEIQARLDASFDQAEADREAIQALLRRPEVREVAGTAGLDLARASAAAAVLEGQALENLASRARQIETDLAGGDEKIVISTTALIIILLLLILLVD